MRNQMSDVWVLETDQEQWAIDSFQWEIDKALDGDRKSINYLRKLWDNEKWLSIKEKLQTEGSVWYVWYMDGVRQHLQNLLKD